MFEMKGLRNRLLIVFSLFFLTACNNQEVVGQAQEIYETPVAVAEVFTGSLSGSNQMTGVAKAAVDIQVLPKSVGQLLEVFVKNGDFVEKGQVLARIDNRDQQLSFEADQITSQQAQNGLQRAQNGLTHAKNNYEQAQIGLRQAEASMAEAKQGRNHNISNLQIELTTIEKQWQDAKTNLERMKILLDEGLISRQQFEEVEAGEKRLKNAYEQLQLSLTQAESELSLATLQTTLDQAKMNVQVAEASIRDAEIAVKDAQIAVDQTKIAIEIGKKRIEETKITAPRSGQITTITAEVGEFVSNQASFARLISTDWVVVEISISAEQLALFEVGDLVNVRIAGISEEKQGEVTFISTIADDAGLFTVKIQVENEEKQIRPGMIATVSVEELLVDESMIVPTAAIIERQGVAFVYVVQGNQAVQKEVEVIRYDTEFAAVIGTLAEKDQVVVKGQNLLSDGDPIRIVKEEK